MVFVSHQPAGTLATWNISNYIVLKLDKWVSCPQEAKMKRRIVFFKYVCVVLAGFLFLSINLAAQETGKSLIELRTKDQILKMRHPRHINLNERANLVRYSPEALKNLSLPSSFDWRDQNIMTPVKDQGYCGSCWAFAAVGMFELLIKKSTHYDVDLSEQQVVDCAEGDCEDGGYSSDALDYMRDSGIVLEQYYPYIARDQHCGVNRASDYYVSSWGQIDVWHGSVPKETRILAIKNAIYTYGPVVVSMYATDEFDYYNGGVFTYNGRLDECNHSVVLVGWKDDASVQNGGYWILRNSYGRSWAENGYGRIAYDTCYIDGCECLWGIYQGYTNDHPPVFNTQFGTLTYHEGQEISLSFAASDADGSPLQYSISFLPQGSSFNGAAGLFSWTPGYTQSGTYAITVGAHDGKFTTLQTFYLIIKNTKVIHK